MTHCGNISSLLRGPVVFFPLFFYLFHFQGRASAHDGAQGRTRRYPGLGNIADAVVASLRASVPWAATTNPDQLLLFAGS